MHTRIMALNSLNTDSNSVVLDCAYDLTRIHMHKNSSQGIEQRIVISYGMYIGNCTSVHCILH